MSGGWSSGKIGESYGLGLDVQNLRSVMVKITG
jgi:hypothetical protein